MPSINRVSRGRPRAEVTAEIFRATLAAVQRHGYAGATMDRIAAEAGVAKTTIYRRWTSKGALVVDVLLDVFGPVPTDGDDPGEVVAHATRWIAGKIGEPGVGAAFAGVFSEGVTDPALRELLGSRLQEPYRIALQEALGEDEQRVLFLIDVVTGTLLHRMGMTGEPMVSDDVDALVEITRSWVGTRG